MLEQFTEAKKQLLSFVDQLKKADCVDRDIFDNSRLEDEVGRLEKGDFKISLVAPFSAGKSTFINAIIGKDLLSMDIRAETSVITKISYSENIKIEVIYHDNSEVDVIDTDDEGKAITYDTCKEILRNITTVRDENNEVKIKEVIVYCPLEICKDNVELIDTPGLFSRHEKHESITNNILPQVNAVIFMIDPDSVGEEHFTDKIQNYVSSAKNSNLEEDGRHIFFVINKIDVFDPEDIEKARDELREVLSGILRSPQIHEVSAYFGMIGKQLASDDIDISEVQKNKKIKIPDPEDPEYTIAGRSIAKEHSKNIIDFSKIEELEGALGKYLQGKNDYLLRDVKSSIKQILSDSINKMKYQIGEINNSLQNDSTEYLAKMDYLKDDIKELKDTTVENINRVIEQKISGGISGGSIDDVLEDEIVKQIIDITKDIERDIYVKWTKAKRNIDRHNAEDIVQDVIMDVDSELVVKIKEMTKNSFIVVQSIINSLIDSIQQQFEQAAEKIEEVEIKNLGKKMENIGNLNVDSIVGNITNKIEKEFSNVIISISKDFSSKIGDLEHDSTSMVKKSGLWNWFKGLFGQESYEERFDLHEFRRKLDNLMDDVKSEISEALFQNKQSVRRPLLEATNSIVGDLKKNAFTVINSVIKVKEKILNDTKIEMGKNKDEKLQLIKHKEKTIFDAESILGNVEEQIG